MGMISTYVAYYRVSTERQGKSGLGLEAQRAAVEALVQSNGNQLIAEYTEVESGKHADRPELGKALKRCRLSKAALVIAKLDRLSRDAHFLLGLQKAGVRFVAADMPEANETMVGFMAVMAQHEREMISRRTKEALAAAKARGAKLGGRRPNTPDILTYQPLAAEASRKNAKAWRDDIKDHLLDLRGRGLTLDRVAHELNWPNFTRRLLDALEARS